MTLQEKIFAAAEFLRSRIPFTPEVGLVLGSGLGDFADTLEDAVRIPYADIPDFPQPTVEGHTGAFVFGRKMGKQVVALQGRLHYYEGFTQQELTLPIRVLAALGTKSLVLTNAAGGVNLNFRPGDLMLIADHINFSGSNPLIGPNLDSFGPRFPDVSDLYTKALRMAIRDKAAEAGIPVQQGVYLMYSGPNYETPAEIRAFRTLGADAVGMSTVPEVIAASHCGIKVLAFSLITNMAAGVLDQPLSEEEVIEIGQKKGAALQALIMEILANYNSLSA